MSSLTPKGKKRLFGYGFGCFSVIILAVAIIALITGAIKLPWPKAPQPEAQVVMATQPPVQEVANPTQVAEQPADQQQANAASSDQPAVESGDPTDTYTTFQNVSACPDLPSFTVGFDSFAPYDTLIVMKERGLDCKNGFSLVLVPFFIDENHEYGEADRTTMMVNRTWDGLLTTWDKLPLDTSIGQLTFYSDETDGADMLVCKPHITNLEQLREASVAYVPDSISEFFLAYIANYQKISRDELTLLPFDDVLPAVIAFNNGEADCFSGWDIVEALDAAEIYGTLIDSHDLRVSVDVGITSYNAIDNRATVTQAFHNAWLETTALVFDNPNDAEAALINWGQQDIIYSVEDDEPYNVGAEWLGIVNSGDYTGWMEVIAMATPADQVFAMNNPGKVNLRFQDNAKVWRAWGKEGVFWSENPDDFGFMVNPAFILNSADRPESKARSFPINSSFQLVAAVDLPQLTEEEIAAAKEVSVLPVSKIVFRPNSTELTAADERTLDEEVIPFLLSSPTFYMKLGGSSSNVGGKFPLDQIERYSDLRTEAIIVYCEASGVDRDRFIPYWIPPQFPDSQNPLDHDEDRYVKFTPLDTGW
jgi:hypothetical protein